MKFIASRSSPSIRFKLTAAFAGSFLAIVGLGLFSLMQLSQVNSETREIRDVWLPRLEALSGLKRTLTTHHLLAARRTQSLDFRELAATGTRISNVQAEIAADMLALSSKLKSPAEIGMYQKFEAAWKDYAGSFSGVVDQLNSGEIPNALNAFKEETDPAFDSVQDSLSALETYAENQTALAETRVQSVFEQARLLLLLVVGGTAIAALLGVVWVTRAVSEPLLRVSRVMRRLTNSVHDDPLDAVPAQRDEIGTLVSAVSTYRDCVARVRNLAEVAEMDRLRLVTAITSMPIGLSIFDGENRLLICNDVYAQMYKLGPEHIRTGTQHSVLLAERVRQGTFFGEDPATYIRDLERIFEADEPVSTVRKLHDGRVFSVTFQPLKDGWLSIHEDVTERRRTESRIQHMASHDDLTDLANRRRFNDKVDEALRQTSEGKRFAVLCVDLDRFKDVNDTYGHPVGDKLLNEVATRLRDCVRETDTVARFGGDEFAILQLSEYLPEGATALAKRLTAALGNEFHIDGNKISIGGSIGIALAPDDGDTVPQLLKNADMALFTAKQAGRGDFRFYEPVMHKSAKKRRQLEADLRQAFEQSDFELFYQPVISLRTNSVTGFEALLRWQHSTRGWVPPGDFVPVTEENGLIGPLGEWILRKACIDAAKWPHPLKVAVNLSPVQLRCDSIVATIRSALAASRLSADRLELEITEGVFLERTEDILETLLQLRALGVRIALDDFGTGYSSLSYLQRFPFDKIKIDVSFTRRVCSDQSSTAIIRAIADMGATLGMVTTAEGIETQEQLEKVRAEGCTEAQGFLFSEPRPTGEVAALMRKIGQEERVRAV